MFPLGKTITKLAMPVLSFSRNFQVSVLGASQPLGHSIALLLKKNQLIHRLSMHDIREENCNGVARNTSHTEALTNGWAENIEVALKNCEIVVVANGQPKKAGQTEHDHFKQNADSIVKAMQQIVTHCPSAFVVIATDPINQTVPLAAKVLDAGNCFNKAKVLGVTGLYTMKAQMCVGELYKIPPCYIKVPVICGHSPKTAVPVFSRIVPSFRISNCIARYITESIRNEDQVADLKSEIGQFTQTSAYATFCTVSTILNAINGYAVEHNALVANNYYETKFFASPVIITGEGATAMTQYNMVTTLEANYISESVKQLNIDIAEGEAYFDKYIQIIEKPSATVNINTCIKTL